MIKEYMNSTLVSKNQLIIAEKIRQMYLCIEYNKLDEKGIEIEIFLKFNKINNKFFKMTNESGEPLRYIFKSPESRIIFIKDFPSFEELLIEVNYINPLDKNGFVNIYPLYYK